MRKTAEHQRRKLVDELATARRSLLKTVGALPSERLDEVFLGTWSVKDLLAEVEASHRQLVAFLESLSAGELVNGVARSPKGRTITIRGLLRAEASDERQHAEQVKTFFVGPE